MCLQIHEFMSACFCIVRAHSGPHSAASAMCVKGEVCVYFGWFSPPLTIVLRTTLYECYRTGTLASVQQTVNVSIFHHSAALEPCWRGRKTEKTNTCYFDLGTFIHFTHKFKTRLANCIMCCVFFCKAFYQVLPLPLIFKCPLAPSNRDTFKTLIRQQMLLMSSMATAGPNISKMPSVRWVIYLGIIILPFIWWRQKSMDTRNSFATSSCQLNHQIKKCVNTWSITVFYRLTLATCIPTITVCTDTQVVVPNAATSLDLSYISGTIYHQSGKKMTLKYVIIQQSRCNISTVTLKWQRVLMSLDLKCNFGKPLL